MAWAEAVYFQVKAQYVFAQYFQAPDDVVTLVRPYIARLMRTETGKVRWETEASNAFSGEFIGKVNAIALAGSSDAVDKAT